MLKMSLMAAASLLSTAAMAHGADPQTAIPARPAMASAEATLASVQPDLGVVFNQGPAVGALSGCWQNQTELQNFADTVTFSKATQVQAITIYTCAAPVTNASVHLKILSHGLSGFPGYYLRKEDGAPTSWVASNVSGVGYEVTYTFAKPFSAGAGKTYWFGLSGNGFDLSQDSVSSPGNGMIAMFSGKTFKGNNLMGDQMFQLQGQ